VCLSVTNSLLRWNANRTLHQRCSPPCILQTTEVGLTFSDVTLPTEFDAALYRVNAGEAEANTRYVSSVSRNYGDRRLTPSDLRRRLDVCSVGSKFGKVGVNP
jgi:hypothetical protein